MNENKTKAGGKMAKNMTKLHYIADEKLGGLEREYVEVNRKASAGDYVHITEFDFEEVDEIRKIAETNSLDDGDFYLDMGIGESDEIFFGGAVDEYTTLSPTDIIRTASGERFRLAERKAEVGEKITPSYGVLIGEIYDVVSVGDFVLGTSGSRLFSHGAYFVLEPVEVETTEAPADNDAMLDIIVELSQTVAKLERKLADLETQSDSNAKDIRTFADEFTEFKHSPSPWAEQSEIQRLDADLGNLRESSFDWAELVECKIRQLEKKADKAEETQADQIDRISLAPERKESEHRRRGGCI